MTTLLVETADASADCPVSQATFAGWAEGDTELTEAEAAFTDGWGVAVQLAASSDFMTSLCSGDADIASSEVGIAIGSLTYDDEEYYYEGEGGVYLLGFSSAYTAAVDGGDPAACGWSSGTAQFVQEADIVETDGINEANFDASANETIMDMDGVSGMTTVVGTDSADVATDDTWEWSFYMPTKKSDEVYWRIDTGTAIDAYVSKAANEVDTGVGCATDVETTTGAAALAATGLVALASLMM